jgi:triosephosphate isomerase
MRTKIVAGNWKMNKSFEEAEDLLSEIAELAENEPLKGVTAVVCPSFPYLELAGDILEEFNIGISAQNCYPTDAGAFTGEVSAAMLASFAVDYCIVGHSERRQYFKEDHAFLAEKVKALLSHDLVPIFCCGEVLAEREAGNHFEVVEKQLNESLFDLTADQFSCLVIAYEPVWAIGTGLTASPAQAQEMHAFIRSCIAKKYDQALADVTTILYGGSCNAANAAELFSQTDVDGGLIGGASLKAGDFWKICQSF